MLLENKIQNYKYLHEVVRKCFDIIPEGCEECGKIGRLDMANISGSYIWELHDWEFLCRKCHMLKDGRIANLDRRKYDQKTFCKHCGKPSVSKKLQVCMTRYNRIRRNKIEACQ